VVGPPRCGPPIQQDKAKQLFTEQDLADAMVGIEYRHGKAWIDEIPQAYKDIDQVMVDAEPLVDVVTSLRQILNVKGQYQLRTSDFRLEQPGCFLQIIDDRVQDVRGRGIDGVDIVVHGAHGVYDGIDPEGDHVDNVSDSDQSCRYGGDGCCGNDSV
jgi:hypothetical protein